ncbi:5,6-dimethylbenzimidazole synthase [Lasiodiplodia theobromae]|uniref:5,6-dimethylbenzimidazole synthase n=1 Tax=Lasiodiplodia theobromae TaxID=45133 RepID=UPI0015C40A4C|nr:5,6-dimethylbenzimidazole synthase [Lasiodiplodia theobromae]KAF4542836.1 5,6-dimethylbenzimidazole synthase [Lasiodiplodia theobromae]
MSGKAQYRGRTDRATVAQKRSDASSYNCVPRELWSDFFTTGQIFRIKHWDCTLRVYVVVEPGEESSRCLMIKTYQVAQPPRPLRGEEKLRQPIGARADKGAQPFSPKTRLNYGQDFEVAHSHPVCPLGHVLERDLSFFVEEYLKVQGKPAERKVISSPPQPRPAPPVEQSHDMLVDTMVTDPPDVLPPDPREEADKALNALKVLPFPDEASAVSGSSGATGPSDVTETIVATEPTVVTEPTPAAEPAAATESSGAVEPSGVPEPIYCSATVESDEEGPTQSIDNQMERPDVGDIKNGIPSDSQEPGSPHQQAGSAEDKAPLLIEWHEEKDESQNHTAAQEDPVEQESLPVTIEITPAEPEPPDTSKVAEASALEKDNPDHEADQDLDDKHNLALDSTGQKDLDDPVDLLDELPDSSPVQCEPDPILDVFAFQVDSLLEEVNRFSNYVYPTVEDAEDSESAELTREATPIDLSNYQSTPEPFEVLYESINESTYSIDTESTPSVSPVVDLKPDWLDDWLQLTPHEIRACVCGRGTTPERSESVHTIATDDKSEGPLTPESTDLNASTGPTSSYHTPAAEFEMVSANEACEETDKIEVAASDIIFVGASSTQPSIFPKLDFSHGTTSILQPPAISGSIPRPFTKSLSDSDATTIVSSRA